MGLMVAMWVFSVIFTGKVGTEVTGKLIGGLLLVGAWGRSVEFRGHCPTCGSNSTVERALVDGEWRCLQCDALLPSTTALAPTVTCIRKPELGYAGYFIGLIGLLMAALGVRGLLISDPERNMAFGSLLLGSYLLWMGALRQATYHQCRCRYCRRTREMVGSFERGRWTCVVCGQEQ